MVLVIDGLSEKSLKNAAKEIDRYARQFADRNREFVQRLCDVGMTVIFENLNGAGDSTPPTPDTPVVRMSMGAMKMEAVLTLRGKDVVFVEFGAGVFYNGHPGGSPNPLSETADLGFELTIGSYGKHQGLNEYWHYQTDSGQWRTSRGTEATMPLYKADMKIVQDFVGIAKQVFGR